MHIILQLFIPTVVGALVGGLTNLLAIKMLFHPFSAVYIGKCRLPFTPGLIPKRRKEVAKVLGQMIMKHLITADRLKKKMKDPMVARALIQGLQQEMMQAVNGGLTCRIVLKKFCADGLTEEQLTRQLCRTLVSVMKKFMGKNGNNPIHTLISADGFKFLSDNLPKIADIFIAESVRYLESGQGQRTIEQGLIRFTRGRGIAGRMTLKLFGGGHLADRLLPHLVDLVRSPEFKQDILQLLNQKAGAFENLSLNELLHMMHTDEREIESLLVQWAGGTVMKKLSDIPLHRFVSADTAGAISARVVSFLLGLAETKAEWLLNAMHLDSMVEAQVNSFSLSELERLIFSVSKRELHMIANLGYVLGGLIGFVQGLLMLIWS